MSARDDYSKLAELEASWNVPAWSGWRTELVAALTEIDRLRVVADAAWAWHVAKFHKGDREAALPGYYAASDALSAAVVGLVRYTQEEADQ